MVVVGNGVLYVLWIPASAGMTWLAGITWLAGMTLACGNYVACGNDGLFAGNRTGRHSRGRENPWGGGVHSHLFQSFAS